MKSMLTALRELDRERRLGKTLALITSIDKLVQAECGLETFSPLPTDRNNAIQRSRACNVSQMEDQLSRPADRYRYPTEVPPVLRTVLIVVLLVFGGVFASDVFFVWSRVTSLNRNSFAVAYTTFLAENQLHSLFRLDQHLLHYLSLAPLSISAGLVSAFAFKYRIAMLGLAFWIGFSCTVTLLLISDTFEWEGLPWHSMLPDALGFACTIPLFVIGVCSATKIRSKSLPRFSILDMLLVTAAFALVVPVASSKQGWLPPIVFASISTVFAFRMLYNLRVTIACNGAAVASGSAMDSLSPPPADA